MPDALIMGFEDQRATHAVSDVSTIPELAPVGIRIPEKFAVPATSNIYPGVCVPTPIAVPLLYRRLFRTQSTQLYLSVSPVCEPKIFSHVGAGTTQNGTHTELNPHTTLPLP
jgi:hypothetical protein